MVRLTILAPPRYDHSNDWEEFSLSSRVELLPVFIVSNRLGLSVGFLDLARRAGIGPPYVMVGKEARYVLAGSGRLVGQVRFAATREGGCNRGRIRPHKRRFSVSRLANRWVDEAARRRSGFTRRPRVR